MGGTVVVAILYTARSRGAIALSISFILVFLSISCASFTLFARTIVSAGNASLKFWFYHPLGSIVTKVRLQLCNWRWLDALHEIRAHINVGTNVQAFQMHLPGTRSSERDRNQLGLWIGRFSDIASVVTQPNPLRYVLCVWCHMRVLHLFGIFSGNQSGLLVHLVFVGGARSQLGNQRRLCAECGYTSIPEGISLKEWSVLVSVVSRRVSRLRWTSQNERVDVFATFNSKLPKCAQSCVQNVERRCSSSRTIVVLWYSLGAFRRTIHRWCFEIFQVV